MIVKPTVTELLEKAQNRYELVIATSKRARQIAMGDETLTNSKEESPVTLAAIELAEGKVAIEREGEENNQEQEQAEPETLEETAQAEEEKKEESKEEVKEEEKTEQEENKKAEKKTKKATKKTTKKKEE